MATPVTGPIGQLRAAGCRVSTIIGHDPGQKRWHYGITPPDGHADRMRAATESTWADGYSYVFRDGRIMVTGTSAEVVGALLEKLADATGPTSAERLASLAASWEAQADTMATQDETTYDPAGEMSEAVAESLRRCAAEIRQALSA